MNKKNSEISYSYLWTIPGKRQKFSRRLISNVGSGAGAAPAAAAPVAAAAAAPAAEAKENKKKKEESWEGWSRDKISEPVRRRYLGDVSSTSYRSPGRGLLFMW
uniref:Uncharacterized protein n=1 Tax=Cacopsylla melanoneura TaxID=428564 RepID=A0A8D9DZ95_9HEMI